MTIGKHLRVMIKQTNYIFLSGLFFAVFIITEFTQIYGDSGWFKVFLLILSGTFLITGIANRIKNIKDNQPK